MTVTVGAYSLCDGTLAGGVAVSDLRVDQRRIMDFAAVLPKNYPISLSVAGSGYSIDDDLTISGHGIAALQVSAIGSGGEIHNFRVVSNTFFQNDISLLASGGTGSGAVFRALSSNPPNAISPVAFNRIGRPRTYAFTVKRTHPDVESAEIFIIGLEDALPSSGEISISTTGPVEATFSIPNGKIQSHDLVQQLGATTFHAYSIIGGPPKT